VISICHFTRALSHCEVNFSFYRSPGVVFETWRTQTPEDFFAVKAATSPI